MQQLPYLPKLRCNCLWLNHLSSEKLSGGFYDQSYIPECEKAWCQHNYFAITYILKGYGTFTDHQDNSFYYHAGDVLIRHADCRFGICKKYDDGQWLEFSTALPFTFYQALKAAGITRNELTFLRPGISMPFLRLAENYLDTLSDFGPSDCGCRAYAAFLDLFGALHEANRYKVDPERKPDWTKIRHARRLLEDSGQEMNHLPMIAEKLGMSYENFRKKFRQYVGVSPNEYRILRRLDKADALLRHTQLSIKEIAAELGYAALSCFTRQYKKYRKIYPSVVRTKDYQK